MSAESPERLLSVRGDEHWPDVARYFACLSATSGRDRCAEMKKSASRMASRRVEKCRDLLGNMRLAVALAAGGDGRCREALAGAFERTLERVEPGAACAAILGADPVRTCASLSALPGENMADDDERGCPAMLAVLRGDAESCADPKRPANARLCPDIAAAAAAPPDARRCSAIYGEAKALLCSGAAAR